ncbi:hypothetical protein LHJ74_28995 [Streptomyces sp. N2-109]|uniref:Secreted protein n=1 Tax=Streptomyces gossypii TaxID=2883101 RepID=A0ABT2K149_9ACTN|nr:hypothetical protein [Streptomyces gossypii]MCT2593897.1 hypothetical protein [Streptomyces gossypii]
MRKLQKLAVVAAMVGSVGIVGAGTAVAGGGHGGGKVAISQSTECKSHDLNVSVLSNIGVLNGLAGNLLNGEGNPGQTAMQQGSTMGCNNTAG